MVETITPVVHGSRARWMRAWILHVLAATATAALSGAALGGLGNVLGAPFGAAGPGAVAAIAGAYAVGRIVGHPLPIPQARRQVPQWWRSHFGPTAAATLYGAGLGVGAATYLSAGAFVAASAVAFISAAPATGAVILGAFGLVRGASVGVVGRATTLQDVVGIAERVAGFGASSIPRVLDAVALVVVAGTTAVASMDAGSLWREDLARAAVTVVALALGFAGVAKLARPQVWRAAVDAARLGVLTRPALVVIPALELAVLGFAVAAQVRTAAWVALALLVAFTAVVVRHRAQTSEPMPCGCFGATTTRPPAHLLARNAALIALAAFGTTVGAPAAAWSSLTARDLVPISFLVVGGVAMALLVARVARLAQGRG